MRHIHGSAFTSLAGARLTRTAPLLLVLMLSACGNDSESPGTASSKSVHGQTVSGTRQPGTPEAGAQAVSPAHNDLHTKALVPANGSITLTSGAFGKLYGPASSSRTRSPTRWLAFRAPTNRRCRIASAPSTTDRSAACASTGRQARVMHQERAVRFACASCPTMAAAGICPISTQHRLVRPGTVRARHLSARENPSSPMHGSAARRR